MRRNSSPRLRCSTEFVALFALFFLFNLIWLNSQISTTSTPGALERSLGIASAATLSQEQRQPDGFFNGFPVYYFGEDSASPSGKKYFYSSSQCVGENYQRKTSWMFRSCRYTFMCYDLQNLDFVVFKPPDESDNLMSALLRGRPFMDTSQGLFQTPFNNNSVGLGGINIRWTMNEDGAPRLKWSPRMLTESPKSFYAFDSNVVMVPFHSMNGANPGHLVWDDFLPIYTLMTVFGLEDKVPLPLRYVLKDGRGLWAACDFNQKNQKECNHMMTKFWPLMKSQYYNESKLTTTTAIDWNVAQNTNKSQYVCARHGLAGIGDLTDHGTVKTHGWEKKDYTITHNHGRAPMLWAFREFAMKNAGVEDAPLKPPYKVVFSLHSSTKRSRNIHFQKEVDMLREHLDPNLATVEDHYFQRQSLQEQLQIASQAAIFITGCGGGAVTATFVQTGAAIFAYYARTGGLYNNENNGEPARLDWDLLNNLGYARVHWMPREDMAEDRETLLQLVKNELERIRRESTEDASAVETS